MPITLEENRPSPSVKLPKVGDWATVAIAHVEVVPWTDFKTGLVKVGNDGKPRTQDKVTGVVIAGTASTGTKEAGYEPITPGQEVTLFLAGHHRWEYIQAKKEHGSLSVGDVGRWKFESEEPVPGTANSKHVSSFKLRAAKPEEAQYVAQAEQVYRRLTSTVLKTVPASAPSTSFEDDEEPF
jgi:hypothetical protein